MALSQKQRKQLKLAQKRRERRPEPRTIIADTRLSVTPKERSRFTDRCPMMLLAVECALQTAYAEDPKLDDLQIGEALVCAIMNRQPESESLSQVLVQLAIEAEAKGANEADWRMAMRIILDSLRTRTSGRTGSREYLTYARGFVGRNQAKLSTPKPHVIYLLTE